ncbi:aspartic proteinase CDR1-like [Nymphaea colorata]|nr:aspartic proteinase CDR1-like [Nymphaea colorata]
MDTGSDLIWTTCCPCDNCSIQTPMFDPLQSSTNKSQSCFASSCKELPQYGCTSDQRCCFIYSYVDESFIEGILATETLLFDDGAGTIKFTGIVFGCVHRKLKFIKFSKDAEFSGKEEVQETPMAPGSTDYVLNLIGISIGNTRLNIQFGVAQMTPLLGDARSIVIDAGTMLTYLAKDVYDQVANAVANVINHECFYHLSKICCVTM